MKITLLLAAAMVISAAPPSQRAPAPPPGGTACTSATQECTAWIPIGSAGARSLVYTTYPIGQPNSRIRRALIMIHGTNRNADHYFETATAAAFLAHALDDTIVISPRIASADGNCHDTLAANEVSYSCGGDSWRSGGVSASHKDIASFDFIDAILKSLANKRTFPNMAAIVVAGHSAGGQFVARYEMANKVHETLGVPVSYVVANPSSYAWPDVTRPLPAGDATAEAAGLGWKEEKPHTEFHLRHVHAGGELSGLGPDLRQMAVRARAADDRLHRGDVRRSAQEAAGVAADDLSALTGGHAAARRLRFVVQRDGARGDAACARRGVLQMGDREARREARRSRSCRSAATTTAASTRRARFCRSSFRNSGRREAGGGRREAGGGRREAGGGRREAGGGRRERPNCAPAPRPPPPASLLRQILHGVGQQLHLLLVG